MQASARGLAKLAAFMANKGTLNNQTLITEEAWYDIMSEPKKETHANGCIDFFTKGGMCEYHHSSFTGVDSNSIYYIKDFIETCQSEMGD